MNIHIVSLTMKNKDAFLSLFEIDNFKHEPEWKSCYCISYHTTCTKDEWQNRADQDNRQEALQMINDGIMHGYLAFDNDLCVGWLNVNNTLFYPRLKNQIDEKYKDGRTALALCYIVKASYRGKHIASQLLDHAMIKLKEQGYDKLLALIFQSRSHTHNFGGSLAMYLSRGFELIGDHRELSYVIKHL